MFKNNKLLDRTYNLENFASVMISDGDELNPEIVIAIFA